MDNVNFEFEKKRMKVSGFSDHTVNRVLHSVYNEGRDNSHARLIAKAIVAYNKTRDFSVIDLAEEVTGRSYIAQFATQWCGKSEADIMEYFKNTGIIW